MFLCRRTPRITTAVPKMSRAIFQLASLVLVYLFCQEGNALTCLSCNGIRHPRICDVVSKCQKNEVCFTESETAHDGVKVYLLGCTARNSSHACSGTRNTSGCYDCCEHDLCNAQLCGEQGYPSNRGPICYGCDYMLQSEACNTIEFCNPDQVCRFEQSQIFSETTYSSGCSSKNLCSVHYQSGIIIGKRKTDNDLDDSPNSQNCDMCCSSDLCNADCHPAAVTTQVIPVTTDIVTTAMQAAVTTQVTPVSTDIVTTAMPAHDCLDILRLGIGTTSGKYTINITQSSETRTVLCDLDTDGGGWTVFQKRVNGTVDFYQNMSTYEQGFGNVEGEFWLGLKNIYELSVQCPEVDLRVDVEKADGTKGYETFSNFTLSPAPRYTLHIGQGSGTTGDANEGMSYNSGQDFHTYDHEDQRIKCSSKAHGGWWYANCSYANLNGEYQHPPGSRAMFGERGMIYYAFAQWQSLKSSQMMLRCVRSAR